MPDRTLLMGVGPAVAPAHGGESRCPALDAGDLRVGVQLDVRHRLEAIDQLARHACRQTVDLAVPRQTLRASPRHGRKLAWWGRALCTGLIALIELTDFTVVAVPLPLRGSGSPPLLARLIPRYWAIPSSNRLDAMRLVSFHPQCVSMESIRTRNRTLFQTRRRP